MRNLIYLIIVAIIASTACLVTSCEPPAKKKYSFRLYMTDKSIDTLVWYGQGENAFGLTNGDFMRRPANTLASGVTKFEVISIKNLDIEKLDTSIPKYTVKDIPDTIYMTKEEYLKLLLKQ